LATTKRKLSEKESDLLTEWDTLRNKTSYVSLRNKLLHYPRIILNLDHPPLQESNCEPLNFLMEEVKSLRDAIVHASPISPGEIVVISDKELALFFLDQQLVNRIVDQTIVLVRIIEKQVRDHDHFLDWLLERENGRFPERAFA
jgi:hypothetical protein